MEIDARNLRGILAAATFVSIAAAGCGLLEDVGDRLKTCEDARIFLVNSDQTRGAVNMIGPDEVFAQDNLLESGQSRQIVLCMDEGDRKLFQVRRGEELVESLNCVASRDSYEGRTLSVIWTKDEITCEGW